MYKITERQKANASRLGVTIRPSTRKGKKIDVFKKGKKVASVGALGYADYDIYLKKAGKWVADSRRKAYKSRHSGNRNVPNSAGFYADKILW